MSIVINNNKGIIYLIASILDGYIRIWNFHSGENIKNIEVLEIKRIEDDLRGICLWDNEYLYV